MKKQNKLRKRKQFNWTFKNGQKVHSKYLTLVFCKTKSRDFKVGFSVTKKIGKAVVRNRTKRRLREAVKLFEFNIQKKHTLVFVAKPEIVDVNFATIVGEVELLLKKSNIFVQYEESN